jgi:hypothetical protein
MVGAFIPGSGRKYRIFCQRKDQKMAMQNACGPIWVFAEQMEGRIQDVSLQLIGKARELAGALNVAVEVVLLGDGLKDQIKFLFAAGADRVYPLRWKKNRRYC